MTESPTSAQLAAPMSTSYASSDFPYGAEDYIMGAVPGVCAMLAFVLIRILKIPQANEHHIFGTEHENVSKMLSYFTVTSIKYVTQEIHTPHDLQLGSAQAPMMALENARQSCFFAYCRWSDKNAPTICGHTLTCDSVPHHLKKFHGIRDIHESDVVHCHWKGCDTNQGRKNFARHVREGHLAHHRTKGHCF